MKRRDEFLVGLLTVAGIAIGIMGAVWLSRGGLQQGYPLYAKFPWGAGLKRGQPVLLVGVSAGYVDKVKLFQNGTLVTTLRIDDEYRVPRGSVATVIPAGIFGDKAVALTPERPNPVSYQPGDTIPVGRGTPGIDEITRTADSVTRSIQTITSAMERELIATDALGDLRRTLAGTNRLVAQLSGVVAAQSQQLSATLASLRRTAAAVDPASVDSTVENLQVASANAAALTADLRRTSAELSTVLGKLDRGDGTAGRLLNDPQLYNDVRALVSRIDTLTADFKRNPRRYINLSIF